jgi:hypothetical protein
MTVSRDDLIFCFDMNRIETVSGVRYLWDYSNNGFHFQFPGGGADPVPQLDASLLFSGAQYLSLPAARLAEFYAKMPTSEWTLLLSSLFTVGTVSTRVLDAMNAAGTRGFRLDFGAADRLESYGRTIAAASVGGIDAAVLPYANRRRVTAIRCVPAVNYTVLTDQQFLQSGAPAYAAAGPIAYDAAIVPAIGGPFGGGGAQISGRLFALALIRGAISSPDMAQLSAMLAESKKPFCYR